jgi:ankyrin repeat protein
VEINTEELLLAESRTGYTAFHLAAKKNHVETLKKMWVWAEEMQINPKELKKKLFLAIDADGYTACHIAAEEGNLESLEMLRIWSKELEINTDEFLLAKTG